MLIHGNCIDEIKKLPAESVDLVVTDPPYGIGFMGNAWDTFTPEYQASAKGRESKRAARKDGRKATGFQDACYAGSYDNSPHGRQNFQQLINEASKECLRVLKPGAFMLVTMTPRQDCLSRVLMAMEDAGFNMGFTSMYWTFASGFPKATNIGKLVDKRLGAERQIIGRHPSPSRSNSVVFNRETCGFKAKEVLLTKASSSQAKALDGSYAGFQPKPAVELIIVAMKPLSVKTYVDQALKNGKGISWLDDLRMPYVSDAEKPPKTVHYPDMRGANYAQGRKAYGGATVEYETNQAGRFPANLLVSDEVLNDHSRFFSLDAWAKTLPFLVVPKASKSEKNAGCEDLPNGAPPASARSKPAGGRQNPLGDPRPNHHPTVKPLQLMAYLITLGSRAGDTVLDPFMGSGTTCIAAKLLNRKWIGIERDAEYCKIAEARLNSYPFPDARVFLA